MTLSAQGTACPCLQPFLQIGRQHAVRMSCIVSSIGYNVHFITLCIVIVQLETLVLHLVALRLSFDRLAISWGCAYSTIDVEVQEKECSQIINGEKA